MATVLAAARFASWNERSCDVVHVHGSFFVGLGLGFRVLRVQGSQKGVFRKHVQHRSPILDLLGLFSRSHWDNNDLLQGLRVWGPQKITGIIMTSYKGSWFGGPKSHCENNDILQGLWVWACPKWPLKITRARAVTTPLTPRTWRTGARGPRRSGPAADGTLPREWGPRGLGQGLPGRRAQNEPGGARPGPPRHQSHWDNNDLLQGLLVWGPKKSLRE